MERLETWIVKRECKWRTGKCEREKKRKIKKNRLESTPLFIRQDFLAHLRKRDGCTLESIERGTQELI